MKVGIIGAGRIGGGHGVLPSFGRGPAKLAELAAVVGPAAQVGGPAEPVRSGDVAVISVPWSVLPLALECGALTSSLGAVAGRVREAHFCTAAGLGTTAALVVDDADGDRKCRGVTSTRSAC